MSAQWNGALTGSMTVRRAPLALQSAAAFSTAAVAPEMTVWLGELRFAAWTARPVSLAASAQASDTRVGSSASTAAMAPCPAWNCLLHGAAASFDGAHRMGEGKRAGNDVRRPLAQRMSGGDGRRDAMLGKNAGRCHADRHDGRLRVLGQTQIFFRPFEA